MSDDGDFGVLVLLLIVAAAIWFFFIRESEEQKQQRLERERQKKRERLERERKKAEAQKEFDDLVSQGMPKSVARAHREYMTDNPLPRGQAWYGEDVSPLTFYGYRVGKTRGLRPSERREIIRYVMRVRLTVPLAVSYQNSWGSPLSRRRRQAIISHVNKLAAQRASRRGYEVAVADWQEDSRWTAEAMTDEAVKLGEYGFR